MASMAKFLFGVPVKSMPCCTAGAFTQENPSPKQSRAKLLRRWSSDDQQQRRASEEARRNSLYTQQKAERALMREQLREKYKLAKNADDQRRLREAGGNVRLARDLRAIVHKEEPDKPDVSFVHLLGCKSLELTHPSKAAAATTKMEALQPAARCLVM